MNDPHDEQPNDTRRVAEWTLAALLLAIFATAVITAAVGLTRGHTPETEGRA